MPLFIFQGTVASEQPPRIQPLFGEKRRTATTERMAVRQGQPSGGLSAELDQSSKSE